MRTHKDFTFVGLFVLVLVAEYSLFSCGDDDDDASMANGDEEDVSPTPILQDDDQTDDDQTDDDDNDNNDDDTTPDDDDTSPVPDADCVAAYTGAFDCNSEGLGDYSLEEWIELFCYGSTDATFGVGGLIVQCYLNSIADGRLDCAAYAICINEIFHPPVLNEDCVNAYETLYECYPAGIGGYTAQEFIDCHCYEQDNPSSLFGYNGRIVQCYLTFPDDCFAYILCVRESFPKNCTPKRPCS